MTCTNCGAPVAENAQFCSNCGKHVQSGATVASGVVPAYGGAPQTSGKAVASLVCGIINVFPLFIVAIVLGHISLSEIKKSGGRLKGEGLAIAGLVLGYLGIIAIPVVLIIAAIAIPNLLRAKIAANEASAVASLRDIINAEMNYQQMHESAGFTCNLRDLSGFLDSRLASGEKSGYHFELEACSSPTEGGAATRFQVVAVPMSRNATGQRAFCADESQVIRVDRQGSAEDCLDHGSILQ